MSEGPELALMYFPGNYRWSIALLPALGGAPWGGAEMGEIHRIGLRLNDRVGDDQAWHEEWTGMAAHLERQGRADPHPEYAVRTRRLRGGTGGRRIRVGPGALHRPGRRVDTGRSRGDAARRDLLFLERQGPAAIGPAPAPLRRRFAAGLFSSP